MNNNNNNERIKYADDKRRRGFSSKYKRVIWKSKSRHIA